MAGRIEYEIGFKTDDASLTASLRKIQTTINAATNNGTNLGINAELNKAIISAEKLKLTLQRATTESGQVSYSALNTQLAKANMTATSMMNTLRQGGLVMGGAASAFNESLAMANRNTVLLNSKMHEVARVMTQSFKYTAAQMVFNAIRTGAAQAVSWTKKLNEEINAIGIVSGKTANQMDAVYDKILAGSQKLHVAAQEYAQAAHIFYQQGLDDREVERRTEITIKAAKAAGQSVSTMSDQLTAMWNTYGIGLDQMEAAASKAAKLGATTAIQFKDIAEAMQLAAPAASQMGVSFDSLGAIIATVGETTRQSASIIGTAYKTIFARFEQLQVDGTDGEITLKSMGQQLAALGINVLDAEGSLKSLDEVIQYTGRNWENWSDKQQIAIAQLVGGTRQYSQFLALMNNFDKYEKNLALSAGETGDALEQQFATAITSIETAATEASESWNRAFSNITSEENLKGFYKISKDMGDMFGNIVEQSIQTPVLLGLIGTFLIGKFPTALRVISAEALAFKDNLTLESQLNANQRQFDSLTKSLQAQVGLSKEYVTLEQNKLNFSRQTADIIANIDRLMLQVSDADKAALEAERERIGLLQQEFNQQTDILEIENEKAAVREKNLQRAMADSYNQSAGAQTANNILYGLNRLTSMTPEFTQNEADGVVKLNQVLSEMRNGITTTDEASINFKDSLKWIIDNVYDVSGKIREATTAFEEYRDSIQTADKHTKDIITTNQENNAALEMQKDGLQQVNDSYSALNRELDKNIATKNILLNLGENKIINADVEALKQQVEVTKEQIEQTETEINKCKILNNVYENFIKTRREYNAAKKEGDRGKMALLDDSLKGYAGLTQMQAHSPIKLISAEKSSNLATQKAYEKELANSKNELAEAEERLYLIEQKRVMGTMQAEKAGNQQIINSNNEKIQSIENTIQENEKQIDSANNVSDVNRRLGGAFKEVADSLKKVADAIEGTVLTQKRLKEQQIAIIEQNLLMATTFGEVATQSFRMISSIGMIMTTVDSFIKQFKDGGQPSLSQWLITIGMVGTMSLSLIKTLGLVRDMFIRSTIATLASAKSLNTHTLATEANNIATAFNISQLKATLIALIAHTQGLNEDAIAGLKDCSIHELLTKLLNKQSIAAITNSKAFAVMAGKMMIAAGAIMIIIGLIKAVNDLNKRLEEQSPAGQLAKITEATTEAAQAAKTLKDAYDDALSTISGLDDEIQTIDNLKEGTLEWKAAIAKANSELISLLASQQQLKKQNYTIDENGLYRLTNTGREAVIQTAYNKYTIAQNASLSNRIGQYKAQSVDKSSRLIADNIGVYGKQENEAQYISNTSKALLIGGGTLAGAGAGAAGIISGAALSGTAIGSIVPGIGNAAGAVVGALVGLIAAGLTTVATEVGAQVYDAANVMKDINGNPTEFAGQIGEALSAAISNGTLTEEMKSSDIKAALAGVEGITRTQINEIANQVQADKDLQAQLFENAAATASNTAAQLALSKEIIDNKFGEGLENSGLTGSGISAVETAMATRRNQMVEEYLADHAKDDMEDIREAYKNILGAVSFKDNGDETTSYGIEGEDGKVSYVDYADETARRAVASEEVVKQLGEMKDSFIDAVNTIVENSDARTADALLTLVGNAGGDFTNLQLSDLQGLRDGLTAQNIDGSFTFGGTTYTAEMAKTLVYETVDQLYTAIESALKSAEANFEFSTYAEDLTNTPATALNEQWDIITKKLTGEAVKAYVDTTQKVYEAGGEQAMNSYMNYAKELSEKFPEVEQSEIIKRLAQVDWSAWNLEEQIAQVFAGTDVTIDTFDASFLEFTSGMKTATKAVKEFDIKTFQETCAAIEKIVKSLNTGDTISDEDYQALVEGLDEDISSYFMTMADGTHALIGDAELLRKIVRDDLSRDVKDAITASRKAEAKYQEQKAQGAAYMSADKSKYAENAARMNAAATNATYGGGGNEDLNNAILLANTMGVWNGDEAQLVNDYLQGNITGEDAEDIMEKQAKAVQILKDNVKEATSAYMSLDSAVKNENQTQQNSVAAMYSTAESYAELTQMHAENADLLDDRNEQNKIYGAALQNLANNSILAATSLNELNGAIEQAATNGAQISASMYGDSLLNIASNYDNCSKEGQKFSDILHNTWQMDVKSPEYEQVLNDAQQKLEYAIQIGEAASQYGLDAETLESHARRLESTFADSSKSVAELKQNSLDLAIANERLNKGLSTLYDKQKDYVKSLKENDKETAEYTETMGSMKDIFADIYNIADSSLISDNFIQNLVDQGYDFENLAKGDLEAIEELRKSLATDIIGQIRLEANTDEAKAAIDEVLAMIPDLDLTIGTHLEGDDQFVTALNEMIKAAHMTEDEIKSVLGSLGMSAKLTHNYEEQKMQVPTYIEVSEPVNPQSFEVTNADGSTRTETRTSWRHYTIPGEPVEVMGVIDQPTIETEAEKGGGLTVIGSGKPSASVKNPQSKGGGGGSNKTSKANTSHKRYRDTQNVIDNTNKQLEKYSNAKNNAFGATKLSLIRNERTEIMKLAQEYKHLADQAYNYLRADQYEAWNNKALLDYDAAHGTNYSQILKTSIRYDETGNIANLEEIQKWWDSIGKSLEGNGQALEAFNEMLKEQTDIYQKIEEDVDKHEEAIKHNVDAIRDYIQKTIDIIDTSLEQNIALLEDDIKIIELAFKELGEAGSRGFTHFSGQIEQLDLLGQEVSEVTEAVEKLYDVMENGANGHDESWFVKYFDQEAWDEFEQTGELTGKVLESLIDKLDKLLEYKDKLIEDYTNIWRSWAESLSYYLEKMDDLIGHYDILTDQLGSWNELIKNTNTQITKQEKLMSIENSLVLSESQYNSAVDKRRTLYKRLLEAQQIYLQAERNGETIAIQETKKNLEEVQSLYNEARTAELNALKDYFQNIKDQTEEYYQFVKEQRMRALGYTSVGALGEAYDEQREKDDWYLDATNKAYGLNTLLRAIDEEMEDITDPTRMQEFLDFQKKVNGYTADTVSMTQMQLDILNAEFDVLKAKDAYENAKTSKNTMRLVRDASGNYAYQYTANDDDIMSKLQEYEDAQNRLYNLQKQYQQQSEENWIRTYEAYNEFVDNVDRTRYLKDEQYRAEVDAKYAWYEEKLRRYTDQIIEADEMLTVDFTETSIGIILKTEDMRIANDTFTNAVRENVLETNDYLGRLMDKFNTVAEATIGDSKEMESAFRDAMSSIRNEISQTQSKITELKYTMDFETEEMSQTLIRTMDSIVSQYQRQINIINDTIEAIQELRRAQLEASEVAENEERDVDFGGGSMPGASTGNIGSTGGSGGSEPGGGALTSSIQDKWTYSIQRTNPGAEMRTVAKQGSGSSSDACYNAITSYVNSQPTTQSFKVYIYKNGTLYDQYNATKKLTKAELSAQWSAHGGQIGTGFTLNEWLAKYGGFDTGGYTGDWHSSEGKLAILHEKELVLSKDDTANILAAVQGMRQIVSGQLGRKSMDIITSSASATGPANHMTIDQKVQIDATFPNVSVASEIEDAFSNLVNQAAQYNLK